MASRNTAAQFNAGVSFGSSILSSGVNLVETETSFPILGNLDDIRLLIVLKSDFYLIVFHS